MSAPLVAGCAALAREYYVQERHHEPSAALLKATLINGTRRLTGDDALADHDLLPNLHQGFGCLFMPWAIPNSTEPNLRLEFLDPWQEPTMQFQRSGQRFRFGFACAGGKPLRLCLTWTDPPGRALQNDLDILLKLPSGTKVGGNRNRPLRLTDRDRDNNVEIVRLEDPEPGSYLLEIKAMNLLRRPQDFALVLGGDLTSPLAQQ
jgi:hypothetical protein